MTEENTESLLLARLRHALERAEYAEKQSETLSSQLAAANARADGARADGYAEGVRDAANALKTEYRITSFWLNGVEVFGSEAATPAACYQTILALRDKPAPALTASDDCGCPECRRQIERSIANLKERAIAGGGDE